MKRKNNGTKKSVKTSKRKKKNNSYKEINNKNTVSNSFFKWLPSLSIVNWFSSINLGLKKNKGNEIKQHKLKKNSSNSIPKTSSPPKENKGSAKPSSTVNSEKVEIKRKLNKDSNTLQKSKLNSNQNRHNSIGESRKKAVENQNKLKNNSSNSISHTSKTSLAPKENMSNAKSYKVSSNSNVNRDSNNPRKNKSNSNQNSAGKSIKKDIEKQKINKIHRTNDKPKVPNLAKEKEDKSKNEVVLSLKNVKKTFYVIDVGAPFVRKLINLFTGKGSQKVEAIKSIDIDIRKGEFIGIIGHNGSGKSTLLKLIIGALRGDKGSEVKTSGRMIRLALGIGFDKNLTARDNIYLNGSILGLSFKEIDKRFQSIIDFADLHEFVNTPIRFYSSGMVTRLSFAIAINADADIFLIDEFFGSVGDANFRKKSQVAFEENILKGKTILHVSHSMATITNNCDRVIVMNKGVGKVFDDAKKAIKYYRDIKQ